MPISLASLQAYIGKPIADICENNFASPTQNHCAHFVSHALNIRLGMLCGDMAFKTKKTGASIRCDELYNRLINRGPWQSRPALEDGLLLFVTSSKNVTNGAMANVPQKHVGIHHSGQVFNFSNSQHKVIADPSVEVFHEKFVSAYAGSGISLYFGAAP